jgi:hypothetical protein
MGFAGQTFSVSTTTEIYLEAALIIRNDLDQAPRQSKHGIIMEANAAPEIVASAVDDFT